ncbi:PepSY domain-containing protein [Methylocystis sp. ATCC 49242]|uniref:WD40/YVTN/BNR-like repeat-containing protein n=1 Tax=Methylocystis sp. ATCC 49242 TaxID=622637 RepID=UPI0001F86AE0|nr:PepSY domain-containing protein [Methylocystis sp. ATCC 49242]
MSQSIQDSTLHDRHTASDGSAVAARPTRSERKRAESAPVYRLASTIHKWGGLIGAVWLAVLGLTGFFLNNNGLRVLQQATAPRWLTSEQLYQNAGRYVVHLLQIDPNDAAKQIGGGPRGLWRSSDGGMTWSQTNFEGGATPQIFAIEPDPALGWGRLWIASDKGLYVSSNKGETARAAGLAGERVTALVQGASSAEMYGVVDKSKVVRFDPDMATNVETLELAPLPEEARQMEVRLHSFVRSLHFGHGLFDVATSRLINDTGGLAMCILALTGLLHWGFGKWWRIRAAAGARSVSPEAKRSILAWLYRTPPRRQAF